MKPKRRGNLLLSALFISAFLFFLSVAIVVTNREDIQYTLLADNRMRAEFAADGALDHAIQLMRNTSDWESALKTPPTFVSGASVQSSYKRLSPTILDLDVTASYNLVKADRHWVLEEMRLADSVAVGSSKPHLFALRRNNWSVLGPNFKWQQLGTLSSDLVTGTFTASGGSLFYQVANEVQITLQDFQPIQNANGTVSNQGFGPISATLPKGNGPYLVALENDQFKSNKIVAPDDPSMLGRIKQPTINGSSNGTPTFATINIKGVPTNVDTSVYQGPIVEAYLLTGSVAAALDNACYCHATHVYYRGFKFQNDASTGEGKITMAVGPLQEPAILKYDLGSKSWTKVVDLLKVPDDLGQPEILPGPRPDQSKLWVTASGVVYSKVQAGVNLLSVTGGQFVLGAPIQGDVFVYQDQLISSIQDAVTGLNSLSQYDPSLTLPKQVPGRNISTTPFTASGLTVTLAEEQPLQLRYSTGGRVVTTSHKDLYAVVKCQALLQNQQTQTPKSTVISLAHWDGTQWQFLPNGMAGVLPGSSYFLESQRDYAGPQDNQGDISALALAGYATAQPLLRRYSPRFHY